ncbi:M28 family peptidase, partial [Candidatus Poribacteria bacterium]|nr:M28 family peptidase [Candidatus Poribacteria bacterium]
GGAAHRPAAVWSLAAALLFPVTNLLPGATVSDEVLTTGTMVAAFVPPKPAAEFSPLAAAFRGDAAWRFLNEQVDYGPRIPGTPPHEQTRAMIARELAAAGFSVAAEPQKAVRPNLTKQTVPVHNIIGRWNTDRKRRLFFSAHYDTRPISDQARSPLDRIKPVPGANDGASGVAVLLEMAHAIAAHPPHDVGVFLVFHDVEDLGVKPGEKSSDAFGEYCLGARVLAAEWPASERFEAGVNFDMVGDKELHFPIEGYSHDQQPALSSRFWGVGAALWPSVFEQRRGIPVIDDHLAYMRAQLPCIDLIDFDFSAWHTPGDTPEACSPSSLYITGTTALEFILLTDRSAPEKP